MELDPRIRIRAPLRCDGIGRLDCAEDADSGARLAVRWLPLEANGVAAVKACEKLPTHPTLPRIRQTGQVGASAFVALDFPDGQLLSARDGERLDNEVVVRMAAQLADALATVHAQGVVHGEMSADSVLLAQGKAYLWDMPLVIANRLTDRRGENRLMQNLVKTAAFLSPERARGEGASQAGDVYALGVVLCVAAGAPLPEGATTLAMVHQVATGSFVPRVPAQLPDAWREVLTRMLASEASQRPTAAEVAKAFADVPAHTALPTVPEFPAVKLPAELLQVAAEMATSRATQQAMRAPTREMSLSELQAATQAAGALATSSLQLEANAAPTTDVAVARETRDDLADVPEADADVVRIPTLEIRAVTAAPEAPVALAVEPTPAPVVAPAPVAATSVALRDNVSVAPELAAASMTLSADEVQVLHAGRTQVGMLVAGVALAVLGVAMVLLVLVVGPSAPKPVVAPVIVPAPAPMVAPVAAPVAADDELAPLLKLAPVKKGPKSVAPREAQAPVMEPSAPTTVVETTVEAAPAAAPAPTTTANDFGFLEGAPAPKTELKRPEL